MPREGKFPLANLHNEDGKKWVKQSQREDRFNSGKLGVHMVVSYRISICKLLKSWNTFNVFAVLIFAVIGKTTVDCREVYPPGG